ncbi:MAG: hypothetical protein ACOVMR_02155 [Flavobacteriales bacterium]
MKLIFVVLFFCLEIWCWGQPGDPSIFQKQHWTDILKVEPDNCEARLERARSVFLEGKEAELINDIYVLEELDFIIFQNPNFTQERWAELYLLRGDYKYYYLKSIDRAMDDYMLALRYSLNLVESKLREVFCESTYTIGRDPQWDLMAYRIIREFVLYKRECFENKPLNHYFFLFQELVQLGEYHLKLDDVEKAKHIADYLTELIPRTHTKNSLKVADYFQVFALQCRIAMHERNETSFTHYFYQYVGAPDGQYHLIEKDIIDYFFKIKRHDYLWNISAAILYCRESYVGNDAVLQEVDIWKNVRLYLEAAESQVPPDYFYMTDFIRAKYLFDHAGDTQGAFYAISKALTANPDDILVHQYKLEIMQDRNYSGRLETINDAVLQALEDDKRYTNLYLHDCYKSHDYQAILQLPVLLVTSH